MSELVIPHVVKIKILDKLEKQERSIKRMTSCIAIASSMLKLPYIHLHEGITVFFINNGYSLQQFL